MVPPTQSEDGEIGFQIAPMVDVVFVLMLFFMACAGMQVREKHLSALTPPHPSRHPALETPIEITIDDDGSVQLLGRLMADAHDNEIGAVTNWLKESRANFGDRDPVVIQPAPTVRHQRIMQVLGAIASAQWPKVSLR